MTRAQLKVSLALWRRRHRFRKRRADYYHLKNNRAGVDKWYRLMKQAGVQVRRRQAQLAKLNRPKPSARGVAVARARSYVGVHETRYNGNWGVIEVWQRRFGFGRVPWCGVFCGNMLLAAGVRNVGSYIASVALIEDMARRRQGCFRGWSTEKRNAQRGDLAVIGNRGQHVELVVDVHGDGSLTTIGGNVSNGVRLVHRPGRQVRGVAHVNYP